MATIDERYREKLRARAEKRVPVFTTEPTVDLTSNTPDALQARYLEKLKRHGKPVPAPAPASAKPEETKAATAAPAPAPAEPKPDRSGERPRR